MFSSGMLKRHMMNGNSRKTNHGVIVLQHETTLIPTDHIKCLCSENIYVLTESMQFHTEYDVSYFSLFNVILNAHYSYFAVYLI